MLASKVFTGKISDRGNGKLYNIVESATGFIMGEDGSFYPPIEIAGTGAEFEVNERQINEELKQADWILSNNKHWRESFYDRFIPVEDFSFLS